MRGKPGEEPDALGSIEHPVSQVEAARSYAEKRIVHKHLDGSLPRHYAAHCGPVLLVVRQRPHSTERLFGRISENDGEDNQSGKQHWPFAVAA